MTIKHTEIAVFAYIDGQWRPCGRIVLGEDDVNLVSSTWRWPLTHPG